MEQVEASTENGNNKIAIKIITVKKALGFISSNLLFMPAICANVAYKLFNVALALRVDD